MRLKSSPAEVFRGMPGGRQGAMAENSAVLLFYFCSFATPVRSLFRQKNCRSRLISALTFDGNREYYLPARVVAGTLTRPAEFVLVSFPKESKMSIPAYKPSSPEFLCGGRIRKTSKGLVSFAPFLAGASALALGALLATISPVEAGSCPGSGETRECTGAASSMDVPVLHAIGENMSATFTDAPGFGLSVTGRAGVNENHGFYLRTNSNSNFLTIDLDGDILADDDAFDIGHGSMTGDLTITTDGTITSNNQKGIFVDMAAETTGDVMITSNGGIMSAMDGVFVQQDGAGTVSVTTGDVTTTGTSDSTGIEIETTTAMTGDINITANGDISAGTGGIRATHNGSSGGITITTHGTVSSGTGTGVYAVTGASATGDVVLNINGDVVGTSLPTGVAVNNAGSGDVTIYVNAEVAGGTSGAAIDLNGGGTQTIVLGMGASIAGAIDTYGIVDGEGTVNIEARGNISDFNFGNVGSKVSNFALNEGAVVSVMGAQTWNGAVTLSGRLVITGDHPIRETGSTFSVNRIEGGGVIDIDVDFSGGDATLGEPRISAQSATGSTTVNVRARGGFPGVPENDEDEAISIGNFIQITDSNAAPNTFVAGQALGGGFNFQLVHDNANNGPGIWTLVATGVSVEGALYETLPAALTQLASLGSYRQRLQSRRHDGNGSVWAKVSSASNEFEPVATSLATHEIENAVAEFGIEVPLLTGSSGTSGSPGNFTVGAAVAFGEATTDVAIEDDTGEIVTSTVKGAISANWERGGAYVDGQLQYAIFGNEINSGMKLADKTASAYSAGLEAGYSMDIAGVRVIPAAQLMWTSVDLGTFMDSVGTHIVLDDGVTVTGRTGIGVEHGWNGALFGFAPLAGILLRGHADVLMPLDGKVSTKISGTEMASEYEDPSFDFGIGAAYAWGDAYVFSADVSARQGGEMEGYAGSIGFEYKF